MLHGATNAVLFLQARLATLAVYPPHHLRSQILWWLANVSIFSKTFPDHLTAIEGVLNFCVPHTLRLQSEKPKLSAAPINSSVGLIDPHGIRFDPRRIDGTRSLPTPRSGAEQRQFVCAMRWMRSGISELSRTMGPLSSFLQKVYPAARQRSRFASSRIAFAFSS